MQAIIDKHSVLVLTKDSGLKRIKTPFNVICITAIKTITIGDRCKVDLVIICSFYRLKYQIGERNYPYSYFIICIDKAPLQAI